MSDYERETRVVRDDGTAAVERETVTDTATGERVTVVREGGSATAWIIAAMVAVVAIIIIAMLMTNEPDTATDDMAAAMDASRAAGYVDGANTAMSQIPPTTTTVPVPVPVPGPSIDTSGIERSAAEAAAAAADARDAAERAADSAANSATNSTP
ncbi:MAG TPA: hypothetical protein VFX95_05335 [Caulobacteraceae bacterium]|nr:hypothetical protein [Caulobacteraceae bacterium]